MLPRMRCLTVALSTLLVCLPAGCPPTAPAPSAPAVTAGVIDTSGTASVSTADVGQSVRLDATVDASVGAAVSYSWIQTAGPGVPIGGADTASAVFDSPSLESDQTLVFRVTTRNAAGDVGHAELSVLVLADPRFGGTVGGDGDDLVARAGVDQTVDSRATVVLDGSASTGVNLSYEWRLASGELQPEIQSPNSVRASFEAPLNFTVTSIRLVFELTVRDVGGRVARDRIIITVRPELGDGTVGSGKTIVRIKTTMGTIDIELDPENAPITVENFLQYVDDGFYEGTIFHRVIADFVVQGGGLLPDMSEKPTRDPITNESDKTPPNTRGTVAMARTTDPDSATSQFYFNVADNPDLDATSGANGYAVFGRVTAGMDVVDAIAAVKTTNRGLPPTPDVPLEDIFINSVVRISAEP